MNLVRDVLDVLLVDARGRPLGRVDGVIASYRPGSPLHITDLEMGAITRARRLHPSLASWLSRIARRRSGPCRIPISDVEHVGASIQVKDTPATDRVLSTERWVRRHIIERMPGA